MKKTHLLSVLALGISAACHAETYPAPVGPSQSDFGGVGLLQTPTARMAREGEMSLNYRDNRSVPLLLGFGYSFSRGWKPRCAIPMSVRKSTAAWNHSPATRL
ncbi:lipoprotein, partial [Salmonella enterica subsp. enterica serovar Heidelberg str. 579083-19]